MERSKRLVGVHKGSEFDSGSQWDRIRFLLTEQVMEMSDYIEESQRYTRSKPLTKSKSRRRTQPSESREVARNREE
jgi:hypothetical protein